MLHQEQGLWEKTKTTADAIGNITLRSCLKRMSCCCFYAGMGIFLLVIVYSALYNILVRRSTLANTRGGGGPVNSGYVGTWVEKPIPLDDPRRRGGVGNLENLFQSTTNRFPYRFHGKIVAKGFKLGNWTHGNDQTGTDTAYSPPPSQPLMKVAAEMADRLPQNVVMVQVLNAGYVEMTLSWICNVQRFPGVIDRTLFIATDQVAYESLLRFDKTMHVVLHPHKTPTHVAYGDYEYYNLMFFRTKMLTALLHEGISIFLTEADAVWFSDPIDYVLNYKGDRSTLPDYVSMSDIDKKSGRWPMLQGGWQLLRATKGTKDVWHTLTKQFATVMGRVRVGAHMADAGNEQLMLGGLTAKASKNGTLNMQYLPFEYFMPGYFYNDWTLPQKYPHAKIVLNNWIVGNKAKYGRAKGFGHWFLMETDHQYFCLEPTEQ